MKYIINLAAVLALLVASFGQYTTVSAADVRKTSTLGVEAYFSSTDPSGCIVTEVGLSARDDTRKEPPEPGTTESLVALSIYQYDNCTGEQLIFGNAFGWLEEGDLQISKRLGSATLNTTLIDFEDASGGPIREVYVDLTWSATGPATRSSGHTHLTTPDCKYMGHWRGMSRFADVTGTVSAGTTNFTPETGSGSIFSGKSSTIFISCE